MWKMCNIKLWLFYDYSSINKYTCMWARIGMEEGRKEWMGGRVKFPGGPVVKTLSFQSRGHGFDSWSGN